MIFLTDNSCILLFLIILYLTIIFKFYFKISQIRQIVHQTPAPLINSEIFHNPAPPIIVLSV